MNTKVTPEMVDRILAAMCKGSALDELVPPDLDRVAFARELEDIFENYEIGIALAKLPTTAQKRGSVARLNRSAKRLRTDLSALLEGSSVLTDLLERAAKHDQREVARQIKVTKIVERKRWVSYLAPARRSQDILIRVTHDVDALVDWTDLLLKINEAPAQDPEAAPASERPQLDLRFDSWHDVDGDEPMRWLVAVAIPRLLEEFFNRKSAISRRNRKQPDGPSLRFAEAVLREGGIISPKTGNPLTAFGIEDYWRRSQHKG